MLLLLHVFTLLDMFLEFDRPDFDSFMSYFLLLDRLVMKAAFE